MFLAVDISGSMRAMDFQRGGKRIDRLEAVKGVVRDFIKKRTGDRIAMVVFGSNAYTQIPLTMDYNTIEYILERLEIGAAGERTAIGDAIGISLKRLQDVESKTNIIILLTDGRSNSGELTPEEASEIAAQKAVRIYTVAVGTHGEAPFAVDHPMLGRQYVLQRVDMDEESLKTIAKKTDGQFFQAADLGGLEKIYNTIDRLEKTEAEIKLYANYQDLYPYFLIPGVRSCLPLDCIDQHEIFEGAVKFVDLQSLFLIWGGPGTIYLLFLRDAQTKEDYDQVREAGGAEGHLSGGFGHAKMVQEHVAALHDSVFGGRSRRSPIRVQMAGDRTEGRGHHPGG